MKVIDLEEAKANLEQFAQECQSSPIIVTLHGKPAFEMVPVRYDDQGFIERLLEENEDFRRLMEDRHDEPPILGRAGRPTGAASSLCPNEAETGMSLS